MRKLQNLLAVTLALGLVIPAFAQSQDKLVLKGKVLTEKSREVVSSVTIYRYYHLSESVELLEQHMVRGNGRFTLDVEFDKEYVINVASNTGVHKRIHLNTEVLKGYDGSDRKFDLLVDVSDGDTDEPQDVAWIFFDPAVDDFTHTVQMPVAFENR